MSRTKMLDPKNVITRSGRMMKNHAAMFSQYLGEYEVMDSKYYFGNDHNWISLSYITNSKLLTKVFSTRIQIVMNEVNMDESWKAKTKLLGMLKAEGIVLTEPRKIETEIVKKINSDQSLMNYLLEVSTSVDLQNIEIEYNRDERRLTISINPYAGAFVWIKLPPVYYDVKLKNNEVKTLVVLLENLRKYFSEFNTTTA